MREENHNQDAKTNNRKRGRRRQKKPARAKGCAAAPAKETARRSASETNRRTERGEGRRTITTSQGTMREKRGKEGRGPRKVVGGSGAGSERVVMSGQNEGPGTVLNWRRA